ncbi:MAG TPA: DUF1800 domain-containing protein [Pyrinomonadaceae bacterium]|jgi:uncharacterized protein (DUF1800 family)|nr:DUF1800 domain-containing protein [Pyrinomonadaceae bacterium]
MKSFRNSAVANATRHFLSLLFIFVLFTGTISTVLAGRPISGAPDNKGKALTEDQKIRHVLNRLGYGARPGDAEKVKAMGLQKYIDQQLDPAGISDTVAENKVKNLEVFNMSTAEVFAKYPNPGALLQMLEGRNRNQNNAQNNARNQPPPPAAADGKQPEQEVNPNVTQDEQRKRREQLTAIYQKYDLRPAGQLVPQIISNRVLRDVYSEKQLQEVMVDFWQNHFNVYAGKAAVRWYIPSYERDVLRKNALGNFKDLLVGTAQHPAMLFYLDNFESINPNAPQEGPNGQQLERLMSNPQVRARVAQQRGVSEEVLMQRLKQQQQQGQKRGINENYARELMELHTLGVDGGYTQKDVQEVARCFTGWTIADPRGYRRAAGAMIQGNDERRYDQLARRQGIPEGVDSGEFFFNSRWHDNGEKTVLGQKIKGDGLKDGLQVIDMLVKNPATAKFIAKKLAVKFVSDNPSEALVGRVAAAFQKSSGDIKTTLKALFGDPEFFAPENYRAKIKTPFEVVVSSIRALGADTTSSPALIALINKMGEVPYGYQAPTGYPDTAEDWVNTGALLERLNFAVALASSRIPGTKVDLKKFEAVDKQKVLDNAIATVLDGEISASTRAALLKQLEQPLPEAKLAEMGDGDMEVPNMRQGNEGPQGRQARLLPPTGNAEIFKVVSLVLGSPEFQRQ